MLVGVERTAEATRTLHAAARRVRDLLPTRSDLADVRRNPRHNLVAGLTVAIVALPLALAFGAASGLGAQAGLVTAVVGGIVAAVFGGSNILFFGAAHRLLLELPDVVDVDVVILRMSRVTTLDATGANVLADAITRLERRGIVVLLSGVAPDHDDVLRALGSAGALRAAGRILPRGVATGGR